MAEARETNPPSGTLTGQWSEEAETRFHTDDPKEITTLKATPLLVKVTSESASEVPHKASSSDNSAVDTQTSTGISVIQGDSEPPPKIPRLSESELESESASVTGIRDNIVHDERQPRGQETSSSDDASPGEETSSRDGTSSVEETSSTADTRSFEEMSSSCDDLYDEETTLTQVQEEVHDIVRCSQKFREDITQGWLSLEKIKARQYSLGMREFNLRYWTNVKKPENWQAWLEFLRLGLLDELTHETGLRCGDVLSATTGLKDLKHHEETGSECPLCVTLKTFGDKISTDCQSEINEPLITSATKLVKAFVQHLFKTENWSSCDPEKIQRKGSTTNNLKTGRMDELDFLIPLEHLTVREDDGWQLVPDAYGIDGVLDDDRWPSLAVNLNGCFQVIRGAASECQYPTHYLVAHEIKSVFANALNAAVAATGQGSEHHGSTVSNSSFVKADGHSNTVVYFPPNVHYKVKLDITPCVQFVRSSGTVLELVPSSTFQHWRPVNCDPPELQDPVVSQAIRVFKGLRDCSVDASSANNRFATRVLHVIESSTDGYRNLTRISRLLTEHCDRAVMLHHTGVMLPSYAIMGTVVKCYKQNPGQPLCSLVADSLCHFEFISPDGALLSRDCAGDLCSQSYITLVKLSRTLLHIISSAPNVDEAMQKLIPNVYHCSPSDLEDHLKQMTSTPNDHNVEEISVPKQTSSEPEQGQARPKEVDATVSRPGVTLFGSSGTDCAVYHVNAKQFAESLLHRIALGEKKLRQALQELQKGDRGEDLYIAVTTSSNKMFRFRFSVDRWPECSSSSLEDLLQQLCNHEQFYKVDIRHVTI